MADEDLAKLKIEKRDAVYLKQRRKKPVLWAVIIALVLMVIILYRFVFDPSVEVEVATVSQVYPSQSFTILNASGYVVAQRKAAVASKTTGRLEWLGVEEGAAVRSGQIIARLEGKDVAASREQAAANLNNARSALEEAEAEFNVAKLDYNRNRELLAKGFIARTEYDASEARYKRAAAAVEGAKAAIEASKAALNAADVSVEYTLIRAPFDAVVLTKNADIGDIITPLGAAANAKAAVVTIADMSSLQVEVDVSESNLEKVKVGQPCEIHLDAIPDIRFRGIVHMIVPTVDRTKASVMVKARFIDKDNRILPEMSAKVAFLEHPVSSEEQRPKTSLNPDAIVKRNGNQAVFLVKGERVQETAVNTGEKIGEALEALTGVRAGDRVVIKPPKNLRNGSKIKIKEK